jgi:hypothetical protein
MRANTLRTICACFALTRVTDVWRIAGKDRIALFYHRPLQAIVNPILDAGFRITGLHEPRLDDGGDIPAEAEQLRSRPWFLIVDAVRDK